MSDERTDAPPSWLDEIDDRVIADVPIPSQAARGPIPMRPRSRPTANDVAQQAAALEFTAITDDDFRLVDPNHEITFRLTRVRRDTWGSLVGELEVTSTLAGVRSADGRLASASFNCSKLRERREWASALAERARTGSSVDWYGLLDELCGRALAAASVDTQNRPLIDTSRPAIS